MVTQAFDLELHVGVSAVPAPFGVLLGLKSEHRQRLASSCRRGSFCAVVAASTRAETVPALVLRETCGGGGGRRERRRDYLYADGGIAVLVVCLMTVLDVVVTLRVLLHRGVASECIESEASTTPAIMRSWPWSPWGGAAFSAVCTRTGVEKRACSRHGDRVRWSGGVPHSPPSRRRERAHRQTSVRPPRRLLRETGVTENESGCASTLARMAELLVL